MCFIKKSSSPILIPDRVEPEPVERHQADASKTKFSNNDALIYRQNIRTSNIGLTDENMVEKKKTLLGE